MSVKRVCVVGIWHLGSVVSACLADLGYKVIGFDKEAAKVADLNRGVPPLFEPGLTELLKHNISSGRLIYTTIPSEAVKGASYVLLTLDTPINDRDEADLTELFATVGEFSSYLENGSLLLVSSQVPVGTCEQLGTIIKEQRPGLDLRVAYSPENLRLGQAIERFKRPDRIVIGGDDIALNMAEKLFSVIEAPKLRMDLRSAEMTKHAINAFLGMSISFINEIANLCDEVGADALKVSDALRSDERIGSKAPLKPGLGFSGGTLARDLKILQGIGDKYNYDSYLVDGILKVNDEQNRLVIRNLKKLYASLQGLTIGILGLTYKPGTSTLRRSPAVDIINELVTLGAKIKASDPKASPDEIAQYKNLEFYVDPYQVTPDSHALIIITAWPEYRSLDFRRIVTSMKEPVLIDPQNLLDEGQMSTIGFTYLGVGRGRLTKKGSLK